MKLGRREPPPEPAAIIEPPGPHLFRDEGLLASWFMAYRIDEELERARRYERPLAAVVVTPQLLPGERLSAAVRAGAAAAAARTARRCDLVGWLDADRVIILMPETQTPMMQAAASRIRTQMWRGSVGAGGQKWTVDEIENAGSFNTVADLLASVIDQQDPAAA